MTSQAPRVAASSNLKLINLQPQPTTPTATELARITRIIAHGITLPVIDANRVVRIEIIPTIAGIAILYPGQLVRIQTTGRALPTRVGAAELDTVIDDETSCIVVGGFN